MAGTHDDKKLCIIDANKRKVLIYDKSSWAELRSFKNMISTMKSVFDDSVKIEWYDDDEIHKLLSDKRYTKSENMSIKIELS